MLLVDRGLVNLDGDVSEHLDFRVRHPKHNKSSITYRMLLTHTSSINDAWSYFIMFDTCGIGDNVMSLGDWLRGYLTKGGAYYHRPDKMRGSWFRRRPGLQYEYSNHGSSLAAYAVEKTAQVAGLLGPCETFNDFVHRYIFGPLGVDRGSASYMMGDLSGTGPADLQRPAAFYPGVPSVRPLEEYFVYGWPEYPCTRWLSSPTHQAVIMANLMQNGTSPGLPPLLSNAAVAEMRRSQLDEYTRPEDILQGLIWYYIRQGGRTLLGHDGCDFGTSTAAFFNPDTNVGFVVASSSDCYDPYAYQLIEDIQNKILDTFEEARASVQHHAQSWDPHGTQRRKRRRGIRGIWDWFAQRFTVPHLIPAPSVSCGPCWWLCAPTGSGIVG